MESLSACFSPVCDVTASSLFNLAVSCAVSVGELTAKKEAVNLCEPLVACVHMRTLVPCCM